MTSTIRVILSIDRYTNSPAFCVILTHVTVQLRTHELFTKCHVTVPFLHHIAHLIKQFYFIDRTFKYDTK